MARKSGKGKAKGGSAGKPRQYVRDNSGRFASSPGGGGKKAAAKPAAKPKAKPAAKSPAKPKAPPKTSTARGRARTKAAEARKALKAGGGTRAARSLAVAQKAADYYKATGTGKKRKSTRAAAKPAAKAAAKPAAKASKPAAKPRKMSKAPANRAKQNYQEARRQVREARMYRGGNTDATVKRLQARVTRMESRRRSSRAPGLNGTKRKPTRAAAKQAAKPAAKPPAKAAAAKGPRKVDLSTAAFEKRAKLTERRARQAERQLAQVDRFHPANKRIRNRAYALRAAADSYASLVRRASNSEFSAGYLFQSKTKASRRTTAPKRSRRAKPAARPAAKPAAAPKAARPTAAAKPAKPKRQTKRQKSDAYVERIQQVGQGRTGIKAKRAAKVQERARFFASLLASSGKTSKKGLVGQDLVREQLATAYANPASIRRTAKELRQALRRTALSGAAGFVRPGQTQRAKRRLSAASSRIQSAVLGGAISPSRLSASRQVAERASAWYSGQRSAQKPGPVRRPAAVRPLMPAKPEAARPAAKPKAKRQSPKQRARRRLASRVVKVQSKSDIYAHRRIFQSRVVGYQGNLLGKPTPLMSRPRYLGIRANLGMFAPNVPARRR